MSAQIEVPRTRNRSRKRPAIEAVEPVAEEPVEEGQAGSVVMTGLAVLGTGALGVAGLRKMAKTRDTSTQATNDQKWMEDDEFLKEKFPSFINAVMCSGFVMGGTQAPTSSEPPRAQRLLTPPHATAQICGYRTTCRCARPRASR